MSNPKMIEIDDAFESTYLSSKFRCTIDNIPELRKLYPTGKVMVSEFIKDVSQFMTGQVRFKFYPCGGCSINADQNYGSLYLNITPKNMEECFCVKYRFSIIAENKKDMERVLHGCKPVSQDSPFTWGFAKFIKLVDDDDKIRKSLTVEVDIEIFTKRTHLRWLKLYPDEGIQVDSNMMYDTAVAFDDQDYDASDNSVSSIGVKVDDEITKLFNVSKEIVCNVSDAFKTRLTDKKWNKGKTYELSGYNPKLVNKFLKSIHTGILRYNDWEDLLYLLEISNEYQVIWIKNEACQLIADGLKIENGIQSFIRADFSDAKELRGKCLEFCVKNCQNLKVTDEWKELKNFHFRLFIELLENVSDLCT